MSLHVNPASFLITELISLVVGMPSPLIVRVKCKKSFKFEMGLGFIQLDNPTFMLHGGSPQVPMAMPANRTKRQMPPTLHHKFGTNNNPRGSMRALQQFNKRS